MSFFNKNMIKVHNTMEVRIINSGDTPVIEAYVGEYASGKSEIAINRALELLDLGRTVTLVDLDLVEPFYTLRPLKKVLAEKGLEVLAWETKETIGLGEAGYPLRPEIRWALKRPHDIILDVGYGVEGAKSLNLLEGVTAQVSLKIIAVINISRPVTGSSEAIMDYIQGIGKVDGLINNTHLGDETTLEVIQMGAQLVTEAAIQLGLIVIATTAMEELAVLMGPKDCMGNPVRSLKRFMPEAFW